MMNLPGIIQSINEGFKSLKVEEKYKQAAVISIERWLKDEEFTEYVPQIEYLVEKGSWDLLLDAFYQVLPFGTAGRRGQVGIGPNRINIWSIQASAQGHSQYLIKKFGDEAKERGIIICYDVRAYLSEDEYDNNRPNPVKGLDCRTLAYKSAEVYAGNGIKVHMFPEISPTPTLSFMIRRLKAISGNMISASHNPPEHNGQKVLNETGGQLLPPFDQLLVDTVVNEVKGICKLDFDKAQEKGLINYITHEDVKAYELEVLKLSVNRSYRGATVYFSPFHGTSWKTFPDVFKQLGFKLIQDEKSSIPDPRFSTITFNIPNPEVLESFKNIIPGAEKVNADIILAADPDADRIGAMSKEKDGWKFYTGNEIGVLVAAYMLEEYKSRGLLKSSSTIVKTVVTTNLIEKIAKDYGIFTISDLLVGFKYIGEIMEKMEKEGRIADFLLGIEESNGSISGNYIREKDALSPGILLAELASKLKIEGKTIGVYLNELYEQFGYYLNYLTEIRLPGAEGMFSISKIQSHLREIKPENFGRFIVQKYIDKWQGDSFLSETDKDSRNLLILEFSKSKEINKLQVIIRPSGTEPKLKFYFEIGLNSDAFDNLEAMKRYADSLRKEIEKEVIQYCYKIIDIDFPDRGFLLFWQLPAQTKLKYFEIEEEVEALRSIDNLEERRKRLNEILKFLGSNPIEKVDRAFTEKNGIGMEAYLNLID